MDKIKNNKFYEQINKNISKKNKIKFIVIYLIVLFFIMYFYQPVISFQFVSTIRFVAINISIILAILISKRTYIIFFIVLVYLVTIILSLISNPIFFSDSYYNLIGEVEQFDYNETQPNINDDIIPVVDQELAEQLGDKVLGTDLGLGSQFTIGEYYLVSTEEDLVWVAPLEPISFFKWLQNSEGSPGYVYVSATDINDVKLVTQVNGNDINLKYTNDSYFLSQIKRHVYLNGYITDAMTDFSFEIDDEGNPYWVISTYEPEIIFDGYDTSGVIIVDAQSGEITKYENIDESPKWVERAQPEQIISQQVEYWGKYKNGFINSIFAQKEVITQTDGSAYVYIDSKPYYYSGLTSIENDESTVGFILVNLKTKETMFYSITGATEQAAMNSAEGQVQQFGYDATFPILLNVYNKPTYFMTLKDEDGLLKQYAYVSVENYNIVGVGETVNAASQNYYNSLKENNKLSTNDSDLLELDNQVIERISKDGAYYYIKLENDPEIYIIEEDLSDYLILTQSGDVIDISYVENEFGYDTISEFNNKTLEGSNENN